MPERGAALFAFDNSYARLPEKFFARQPPGPVSAPRLVRLNEKLARQLVLDPDRLASPEGVEVLAGNRLPQGADPLAMAYAGHQFGHWVPQLGDGRALLLGEVIDREGVRRDIQLKGSGRTPFSRNGDGRAALGPVLREYIVSEAMAALGIATTRSLAAVTTGERIMRQGLLPGAVLTRVSRSHIRVGTFEFFAGRGDTDGVRALADYAIARLYPEALESPQPYVALLESVVAGTAALVAGWMLVGFIHGVMNTDNMSIACETIDYGPCAFMDIYSPATIFSSIDHAGRYAYANQPRIAQWNLARFARTLLPLIGADETGAVEAAQKAIDAFPDRFEMTWLAGLRRKLGLVREHEADKTLALDLLERMAANNADFTLVFRRLCDCAAFGAEADEAIRGLFDDSAAFNEWACRWRARLALEERSPAACGAAMRGVNPAFIPRNHRVEAAIQAAEQHSDFSPFEELLSVLSTPCIDRSALAHYANPPRPEEIVHQTFCGT
ncbi:MAG TPA: YdiU family protein [Rhizomicrobium sp.]